VLPTIWFCSLSDQTTLESSSGSASSSTIGFPAALDDQVFK
jgi:hypothetical protein